MKSSVPAESREVNFKIERYDDIFSDFDNRPFFRRSLSVDFLEELQRAVYDKDDEGIEVVLNVPAAARNEANELKIKRRLKEHFLKHYRLLAIQKKSVKRRGLIMVAMGMVAMGIAASVIFNGAEADLFRSFLVVFLEPAAWFLLWEGMDLIIFGSKDIDANLRFYKKMSHAHVKIYFAGY